MYGRIENKAVTVAPREIDGVIDPPEAVYLAHGWFPVEFTAKPDSDYESGWEQVGNTITQTWTPPDPDPEISDDELLDILMGVTE